MGTIYSYLGYSEEQSTQENKVIPKRIYNWKKSSKRPIEMQYLQLNRTTNSKFIDLSQTKQFPAIYDQQTLGSCTANALCCAYAFDSLNGHTSDSKIVPYEPSRLYLYYKEREKEHDIPDDNGAVISDGIDVLQNKGVCSESKWPYDISKFADKPTDECDKEALEHKLLLSKAVKQTQQDIESCINAGFPIVFGFVVYQDIENLSSSNGYILPMPKDGEQPLGGHAVVIVGYDSDKKLFKIRNSWGSTWGDNGHFYIPYDYILNQDLASDFWLLTQITDVEDVINSSN